MGGALAKIVAHPERKEEIAKVFRSFDKDKSGFLTKEEFEAFVGELVDYVAKVEPDTPAQEFIGAIAGSATVCRSNEMFFLKS